MATERLEGLAQGSKTLGSDVVNGEPRSIGSKNAGVGQVVSVDELMEVVAGTEDRDVEAALDPVAG